MSRLDRIVGYIAAASFFGAGVCFVFAGCGMLWNALFGEDRAVCDAHGRDSGGMSVGHFEERVVANGASSSGAEAALRTFFDLKNAAAALEITSETTNK